ncbi:hypothetical protein AB0L22_09085 [Micromonospora haikouensis]|uniref:hypothetical protein n=1 Tax=Micromonospora haikouensis TaxID=686309 RepID=UPI003422CBD8
MTDSVELAQVAYQAYGEAVGFKNYLGDPMPTWDDLGDTIQQAWTGAAEAIRDRLERDLLQSSITRMDHSGAASAGRLPRVCGAAQEVLCDWIRANGLDPQEIPTGAGFEIHDGQLTIEVVVLDDDGNSVIADSGFYGVERTTRTVPLVEPFPVRHWLSDS